MSIKLDGKKLSLEIQERLKKDVLKGIEQGCRAPSLAVIRIGDDPASGVYVNNKERACEKIGIMSVVYHLNKDISNKEVGNLIDKLNSNYEIDGILLQLPLPPQLDSQQLISRINPSKDVDGLHETNAGRLIQGKIGLSSCTPAGIINLLRSQNIQIESKNVVVIGRSLLVGKPISIMMLNLNGTVTITHSKTKDLKGICLDADILIVAAGKPNFIDSSYVKNDAVIIDVGIHRLKNEKSGGTKLCGDVILEDVIPKVSAYTPVPGGVGPMTVTMLLVNTIFSWQKCFGMKVSIEDLLP